MTQKTKRISDVKREKMFQLWLEKPHDHYVAQKCNISPTTVKRYRIRDNWTERRDKIRAKAQKKTDNAEVERITRHVRDARVIQQAGLKNLVGEDGKVQRINSQKTAVKAIIQGARAERDAVGVAQKVDVRVGNYDDWTDEQIKARLAELEAAKDA